MSKTVKLARLKKFDTFLTGNPVVYGCFSQPTWEVLKHNRIHKTVDVRCVSDDYNGIISTMHESIDVFQICS